MKLGASNCKAAGSAARHLAHRSVVTKAHTEERWAGLRSLHLLMLAYGRRSGACARVDSVRHI